MFPSKVCWVLFPIQNILVWPIIISLCTNTKEFSGRECVENVSEQSWSLCRNHKHSFYVMSAIADYIINNISIMLSFPFLYYNCNIQSTIECFDV